MNGVLKFKVAKKEHTLRFSMLACSEFEKRIFKTPSSNNVKLLTDLVYAGLFGDRIRNDEPVPEYSEAYDIIEELSQQKDYSAVSESIFDCYNKSKYGAEFVKKIEEYNEKKKTENP